MVGGLMSRSRDPSPPPSLGYTSSTAILPPPVAIKEKAPSRGLSSITSLFLVAASKGCSTARVKLGPAAAEVITDTQPEAREGLLSPGGAAADSRGRPPPECAERWLCQPRSRPKTASQPPGPRSRGSMDSAEPEKASQVRQKAAVRLKVIAGMAVAG